MHTPEKPKNKGWHYTQPGENRVITATSIASLALLGVTAVTLFTPVAYMAAAGYVSARFANSLRKSYSKNECRKDFNKLARKNQAAVLEPDHPFSQMVAEVSRKMERDKAPEILVMDVMVFKAEVPLILRPWAKQLLKPQSKNFFAALPQSDQLVVTKEALERPLSAAEKKFIIAHEMAHLKIDKFNSSGLTESILDKTKQALLWGAAATIGFSAAGVALPVSAVTAPLWVPFAVAALACYTASAINALGYRQVEKRADRNALYTTDGDVDAALQVMRKLYVGPERQMNTGLTSAHPGFEERTQALYHSKMMTDFTNAATKQAALTAQPEAVNNNDPKPKARHKRFG